MKNKKIIFVCFLVMVLIILLYIANGFRQEALYEEKYNSAFIELFVTERNEVFSLYKAVEKTMESPEDKNYENALMIAKQTEQICVQTFGASKNIGVVYIDGNVYYSTFYRDIKVALESRCDARDLEEMYRLLGEIIALYDGHSNPADTDGKRVAMIEFYNAISLMNEELSLPFD